MPTPRDRTAARRLALRRLLEAGTASTQAQLCAALARSGHRVTQATISRDLAALGATKVANGVGDGYAVAPGRLAGEADALGERMKQFVLGIDASANLVVLRTPPGSAHAVAVAADAARDAGNLREALGTIAGDDTVLVITRSATGGARLARKLEAMME